MKSKKALRIERLKKRQEDPNHQPSQMWDDRTKSWKEFNADIKNN